MDLIRLVFSKKSERDLSDFFTQNCIYKYKVSDDFDILPDGIYHEYMDDEEFTECQRSALLIKNMGDLTMWELGVLETQELSELHVFLERLFSRFHGYVLDAMSDHLWTWEEIENQHKAYGHRFFDRYGWKYLSGPYIDIGIMDSPVRRNGFASYQEEMEFYQCIRLPDEILEDWWEGVRGMDTYIHDLSQPGKALARYGYTLIPPESLELFEDVILTKTDPNFLKEYPDQIEALLILLRKAGREGKYIIHFGV